jgi:hypothetical protein
MRAGVFFIVFALLLWPVEIHAEGNQTDERTLTVLETSESAERLDPGFEMVMEKVDNDLQYLLSAPMRLTPKGTAIAGLTLITTLVLIYNDEGALSNISGKDDGFNDDTFRFFNDLGEYVIPITAGAYIVGYLFKDQRIKSSTLMSLEAAALTALFTGATQLVLGRDSPGAGNDPNDFKPFSGFGSMPDMDTALTFSIASVLAYQRGLLANILWYGVATGVGLSQLYYEDAWPSDVFLGAVFGTVIGRAVSYLSTNSLGEKISLAPTIIYASKPAYGLKVSYRF